MGDNTDEASRNDGINVTESDKDDTLNDVSNLDSGGENANNVPENITDQVSTIEPAPFVGMDNTQTMMNSTASENFAVSTSVIEHTPSKVKFGLLPHGAYALIPVALSIIAWFACLSKDGCDYARVIGPSVADIAYNRDVPFIHVGFMTFREPTWKSNGDWYIDKSTPCLEYNIESMNKDGAWYFAYCTAFLGLVLGGGGAIFIFFSLCVVFEKNVWRWAGSELLIASIFQSLTYTWFATSLCKSNECHMEYGARADLVATILWLTSALCIFCMYPRVRGGEIEQNQSGEVAASPERNSEIV